MNLEAVLEGMLFIVGEDGLSYETIEFGGNNNA